MNEADINGCKDTCEPINDSLLSLDCMSSNARTLSTPDHHHHHHHLHYLEEDAIHPSLQSSRPLESLNPKKRQLSYPKTHLHDCMTSSFSWDKRLPKTCHFESSRAKDALQCTDSSNEGKTNCGGDDNVVEYSSQVIDSTAPSLHSSITVRVVEMKGGVKVIKHLFETNSAQLTVDTSDSSSHSFYHEDRHPLHASIETAKEAGSVEVVSFTRAFKRDVICRQNYSNRFKLEENTNKPVLSKDLLRSIKSMKGLKRSQNHEDQVEEIGKKCTKNNNDNNKEPLSCSTECGSHNVSCKSSPPPFNRHDNDNQNDLHNEHQSLDRSSHNDKLPKELAKVVIPHEHPPHPVHDDDQEEEVRRSSEYNYSIKDNMKKKSGVTVLQVHDEVTTSGKRKPVHILYRAKFEHRFDENQVEVKVCC